MKKILFLTLTLFAFYFTNAQPYKLDKNFGDNGKVIIPPSDSLPYLGVYALESKDAYFIQDITIYDNEDLLFSHVLKFNKNGDLDSTFAGNGRLDLYKTEEFITFISMISEDKLGIVYSTLSSDSIIIASYDLNGKLINRASLEWDKFILLKNYLYKDGYYYIDFFHVDPENGESMGILKIDENCRIDSTFGKNGVYEFHDDSLKMYITGMNFFKDGIVCFGTYDYNNNYWLTKIDLNGNIDSSFADNGINKLLTDDFDDGFYSDVMIDSNNYITVNLVGSNVLMQFDENGFLNTNYGYNGFATFYTPDLDDIFMTFTKQTKDGSVYAFGGTDDDLDNKSKGLIGKLNNKGFIDSTFAYNGFLTEYSLGKNSIFYNGLILKDSSILATGGVFIHGTAGNPLSALLLTKYKPSSSATPDISKNIQGITVSPNPVNAGNIRVQFELKNRLETTAGLYSLSGNKIAVLYTGTCPQGKTSLDLKLPGNLPPATYLLKVTAGGEQIIKKIIVMD